MMRALELLNYIGALSDEGKLTELGDEMCQYPLDPQLAKMLLSGVESGCGGEMLSIVSMLSVPNAFLRPKESQRQADRAKSEFTHPQGDHMTLLNVFESFLFQREDKDWCWKNFLNIRTLKSAKDVRNQLERIVLASGKTCDIAATRSKDHIIKIKKAILSGYFMQVAH